MSTLTYESDGLAISVTPDRQVFGERWSHDWRVIDATNLETIASGSDLETATYDLPGALESLAGFLGAFAEAHTYGTEASENRDLFPAAVLERVDASSLGDWAAMASEELSEED